MANGNTCFTRYRPTKVADGKGGFIETVTSPIDLWGDMVIHEATVKIVNVSIAEDVEINDIIELLEG